MVTFKELKDGLQQFLLVVFALSLILAVVQTLRYSLCPTKQASAAGGTVTRPGIEKTLGVKNRCVLEQLGAI
jgi:hypothetical protein